MRHLVRAARSGLGLAGVGLVVSLVACSKSGSSDSTPPSDSAVQVSQSPPTPPAAATSARTSEPAPQLPALPEGLSFLSGTQALERVKATKAKGVLINAWASWCGPCREEMPLLLQLQKKVGEANLELVFVSVDKPEQGNDALQTLRERGAPIPSFLAQPPLRYFKQAMTPRWRGSLPATFLFDPTGKLRYWWGAQVFEHEITPIIEAFLRGEDIDGEANFKVRQGGDVP